MSVIQIVWAHPRPDSLTARVVSAIKKEIAGRDITIIEHDLQREGFDPVLREIDEPDWDNVNKVYSDDINKLASDLYRTTALIIVFPVWWFSMPALLTGYIDRVWNHGIAYGSGRRLGIKHVRWIGLAGYNEIDFNKRGIGESMAHCLDQGIAGLCGITDSEVVYLYNTRDTGVRDLDAHYENLLLQGREVARELLAQMKEATSDKTAMQN